MAASEPDSSSSESDSSSDDDVDIVSIPDTDSDDSDDDEFYDRTKASQEPSSKRSKTEMVEPDDIKDWVVEVLPMEKETLATLSSKLSQCRSNYSKLQEMLEEDRHRHETWETYCFTHGLPTRGVGSWLSSTNAPTCGNARRAVLATKQCQHMFEQK